MTGDEMREALVTASTAVGDMAEDWWCPKRTGVRRTECRYCIAEFAADALLPVVRKIAADELRAAADWLWDDNGEAAAAYHHLTDRADDLDPS